jgi:ABC-type polysaccharide/polyol phosphate transport system ATPase subunit
MNEKAPESEIPITTETLDDIAVEVNGLSKAFRLYTQRTQSAIERFLMLKQSRYEKLWALDDVTFDVPKGQVFGIIGPNGSGKSTLLKILAGIYQPTKGTFRINGKVAALLELGAGFHPELTGRENIYLNGSILGMTHNEMDERFAEIVEFSGLERFLDTPIKNYSSGMVVRLGFSVAVAIDPEILLIDEVLGVGDIAFAKKSFDRIQQYAYSGRTILFVSHDMSTVNYFCDRVLRLDEGRLVAIGDPKEVTEDYITSLRQRRSDIRGKGDMLFRDQLVRERKGTGEMAIESVKFFDPAGKETYLFKTGDPMRILIEYATKQPIETHVLYMSIHRPTGEAIIGPLQHEMRETVNGPGHITINIDEIPLLRGEYMVTIGLFKANMVEAYDYHDKFYTFSTHSPADWEMRGFLDVGVNVEYGG